MSGTFKVSFKNVGVVRYIRQGFDENGILEVDLDPDGLNSKAIDEEAAQVQQASVRQCNRIDELLVLVAQQEGEIARHIEAKNHTLKLLADCHKTLEKYKKRAASKKKRMRK